MSIDYDDALALAGTDASGLDPEFAPQQITDSQETEASAKTSVLGRLGTSGYMQVIPDRIHQRQQEEGEES